jgi:hypothetical protein
VLAFHCIHLSSTTLELYKYFWIKILLAATPVLFLHGCTKLVWYMIYPSLRAMKINMCSRHPSPSMPWPIAVLTLWACIKRQKCHVNSYIRASKFVFLTREKENVIFLENSCEECPDVDANFFYFLIFWNMFSNSKFICIHQPNRISPESITFLNIRINIQIFTSHSV